MIIFLCIVIAVSFAAMKVIEYLEKHDDNHLD